ncbi:MAG: hypothetical protein QOD26_2656 [Betaproteobacteria bacterium]|jgi:hypothetical protein|nr:hypothetical protein [Betaproteobacteria bacterium]
MSADQAVVNEHGQGHKVKIIVDDVAHQVRAGSWIVSELKAAVGVDPVKVLALITPHGLKDLPDDGKIAVHEGAQFMSHARSGAAS